MSVSAAVLGHWSPPQGPMPNEEIDSSRLDSLEKYRSYTRYVRAAEEADRTDVWWKTYRKYRDEERKEGKLIAKRNEVQVENSRNIEHKMCTVYRCEILSLFCFYFVFE